MTAVPTPSSSRDWLDSLGFFGIKLGLDNIRALLRELDNPHDKLATVHVAGTNGKGSVLSFLDAMLRHAGYSTGRFTSPHLVRLNERFLLNGIPVDDKTLERHVEILHGVCEAQGLTPTYFEICTAIAFSLFHEAGVDLALIETGMGGRLDSTNVLSPALVAITTIDFDHMQYLGDTLPLIAREKAGIVKPGVPVVVGRMPDEAAAEILAAAEERKAPVHRLGQHFDAQPIGSSWAPKLIYDAGALAFGPAPLGLAGRHQADNAAVAVEMAMQLQPRFRRINDDAIVAGLRDARWPCRLERVSDDPPIIIDAAHNAHGMAHYPSLFREAVVVYAASADKDAAAMLRQLEKLAKPLILTAYDGPRSAAPESLAELVTEAKVVPDLGDAIRQAIELAGPRRPVLITGSIFLAGEARALLEQMGLAEELGFR